MGTFTSAGYSKNTATELKEQFVTSYEADGTNYVKSSANVQNNLIDTIMPFQLFIENEMGDLANGYSLTSANFIKETISSNLGLDYRQAKNAQATIKFTGAVGTYIPMGTELNGGFVTTESATIGDSGTAFANAESTSLDSFAANTITTIQTGGLDGVTATNPSAAISAIGAETYAERELATMRKLRNAHVGSVDYLKMKLLEVEGTTEQLINVYAAGLTTIVVCGGGNAYDICKVLFDSTPTPAIFTATQSDGKTDRIVTKTIKYGGNVNSYTISYVTPKLLEPEAVITISVNDTSVNMGLIRKAVSERAEALINGLNVGEKFNKNMLRSLVFSIFKEYGLSEWSAPVINISFTLGGAAMNFDANDVLQGTGYDTYFKMAKISILISFIN